MRACVVLAMAATLGLLISCSSDEERDVATGVSLVEDAANERGSATAESVPVINVEDIENGSDDQTENPQTLELRSLLCSRLRELLEFKDKPDFKQFGFAIGGPYNKWLKDVEALRDAQPIGMNHPTPVMLRVATGDILTLGLEYVSGDSTYARQTLPELKATIGYDSCEP